MRQAKKYPPKWVFFQSVKDKSFDLIWLRGPDLNQRPVGYEPNELPDCSTPRYEREYILLLSFNT